MNSSLKNNLEYYFAFNLKLFPLVGLRGRILDNGNKAIKFLEKVPTFLTNLLGVICLASQIWFISDALPENVPLATKTCSQLITNVQSIFKGFLLACAIGSSRRLLRELIKNWNNHPPYEKYQKSILNEAEKSLKISKLYFAVFMSLMCAYDLPPLINTVLHYLARDSTNHTFDYSRRIILVKYPYEINSISIYLLAVLQEAFLLFSSCIYWINSDTLFVQFTTHICLQFKILQYDIEQLINQENYNVRLFKNFVEFSKRHQNLLGICDLMNKVYSPVIFSSVLAAAINICVNMIGVRDTISKGDYQETGIYLFLFIGIFLQIFLYCHFAEKLTEQTSSIANSIYNCKWTLKHHRFRVFIQLIIIRAQKPFYCTALGFFEIGHRQLFSVIKTSFSYYMMLETVNS